jgi:antirestriction protein ArdC
MAKGKMLSWDEVQERLTNDAIKALENGVDWMKPWSDTGAPKMLLRNKLSGFNVFICLFSGHQKQLWLNFRDIKRLDGVSFKEGFQAPTFILRPVIVKRERTNADGQVVTHNQLVGFGEHKIWNVEQFDGIEKHLPKLRTANEAIETAEALIASMPDDLPRATHGGDSAHYTPSTHSISMPELNTFESSEMYYSVYFHELTHATSKPLGRELGKRFGGDDYSREELIAELGANLVANDIGIATERQAQNSAAYIAHWTKAMQADPSFLNKVFKQSSAAAKHIMSGLETE